MDFNLIDNMDNNDQERKDGEESELPKTNGQEPTEEDVDESNSAMVDESNSATTESVIEDNRNLKPKKTLKAVAQTAIFVQEMSRLKVPDNPSLGPTRMPERKLEEYDDSCGNCKGVKLRSCSRLMKDTEDNRRIKSTDFSVLQNSELDQCNLDQYRANSLPRDLSTLKNHDDHDRTKTGDDHDRTKTGDDLDQTKVENEDQTKDDSNIVKHTAVICQGPPVMYAVSEGEQDCENKVCKFTKDTFVHYEGYKIMIPKIICTDEEGNIIEQVEPGHTEIQNGVQSEVEVLEGQAHVQNGVQSEVQVVEGQADIQSEIQDEKVQSKITDNDTK